MCPDEYMRKWREAHREQIRATRRAYYAAHAEKTKASAIQWARDHPLDYAIHRKVAAANRRYPGRIAAQDVRQLIERTHWRCYWCHKRIEQLCDLTLEHLEPRNDVGVLTIACRACNSARRPLFGWNTGRERRAFLKEKAAKRRAYERQWRIDHREQLRARASARYYANLELNRAKAREYQRKRRVS